MEIEHRTLSSSLMQEQNIEKEMADAAAIINTRLDEILSFGDKDVQKLVDGMRYSAMSSGKRIRPFLTLLVCKTLGGDPSASLDYACALELIHNYSLIHDDLPAMDNDDYRRGKLTNHKVFGEATAILAGDALLTYAFEVAASNDKMPPADNLKAVLMLAQAAGPEGMIAGQQLDIASEGRVLGLDSLLKIHRLKTGALINAAVMLGVLASGRSDDAGIVVACSKYAEGIGLCFQIIDDILDAVYSQEETGKSSSDAQNEKVTFASVMPTEEAYDYAVKTTVEAIAAVSAIDKNQSLTAFAKYLLLRDK